MRIGYVRAAKNKGKSVEAQIDILKRNGAERIQGDVEEAPRSVYEVIQRLRLNDVLMVAWAERLADNQREFRLVVDAIHAKGATAIDASTGARSTESKFVFDALSGIYGERYYMTPEQAKERGIKGGRPAKSLPMTKQDAEMIWRDARLTSEEAAAKIGVTTPKAYRWLGKRGMEAGRPRKIVVGAAVPPDMKVYFARNGVGGAVKIGTTANLNGRLSALMHPLMQELQLLGTLDGGFGLEKDLHRRFAKYRIKGEWFRLDGALKKFVDAEFGEYKPPPPKKAVRKSKRKAKKS